MSVLITGNKVKHIVKTVISGMICAGLLIVTGCGSDEDVIVAEVPDSGNSTPTETFEDDSAYVVTPDGSGLRINYVDPNYETIATPDFILQQWSGMKQCLQVEVPDGYIVVEANVIPPENATHIIEMPGKAFASALDREFDVFVQIRVDDFSEDSDDRGYHFRQIIGPYMWRYNELDARAYDPNCAAFVVR